MYKNLILATSMLALSYSSVSYAADNSGAQHGGPGQNPNMQHGGPQGGPGQGQHPNGPQEPAPQALKAAGGAGTQPAGQHNGQR